VSWEQGVLYFRLNHDWYWIVIVQLLEAICSFLILTSSTKSLYVPRVTVAPDHTQWHKLGRNPLGEGSARRIHKRQISMLPEGFETAIPAKQAAAHLHFRKCGHWVRLEAINNTERVKYVQCVVLCEILIGGTHTHANKN